MVRGILVVALAAATAACSILAPLGGLTGGAAEAGAGDGSADAEGFDHVAAPDTAPDTAPTDAPPEAPAVACEGGLTACSGACVNLASEPSSCGRCGHDCGGGACTASFCQPATIADAISQPRGLAVAGSMVYFTTHATPGSVNACPVTGCGAGPQVLTGNLDRGSGIVVAGTTVAYACFGETPTDGGTGNVNAGVFQCSTSGCQTPAPYPQAPGSPVGVATDGTTVFWNDASFGQVFSCPLSGCPGGQPTLLAHSVGTPWYGIAVDATRVYFGGRGDGTIYACPKSGCPGGIGTPLATGLNGPFDLAVDADTVYFTTFDPNDMAAPSPVLSCPLAGCTGAPAVVASNQYDPSGIAVDSTGVYWANYANGAASAGSVAFCPKAGCAQGPTLLASGQDGPFMVALDAGYVYWTNTSGGQVMRVAKP